ncbi:DUF6881 domain-containing protein [Tundrisphaera lichenicola]|uniref:DUF6881 domain-containing protein n=1 Tax=Tundrisphaera lichenicola TaxID=2029860 RepID=UPI003EC06344
MRYIHVTWIHDHPDEPVELYSEIDGDSWEVRKVEVFRDGKASFASRIESNGSSRLGEERIPPIAEIAREEEFQPEEISEQEFERIWNSAHSLLQPR